MFGKDDTIKFDYEAVQKAYTAIHDIFEEAVKVVETLKQDSKNAEEKMKGQYKSAYSDKSEDIFKELKKNIKNIEKLSKNIEKTSDDFLEQEMILANSYGK